MFRWITHRQRASQHTGTCVQSKLRGNFDIREKWVQELRDARKLKVDYVHTSSNLADLLTKTHSTRRFQQLLKWIQPKNIRVATKSVGNTALLVFATAAPYFVSMQEHVPFSRMR